MSWTVGERRQILDRTREIDRRQAEDELSEEEDFRLDDEEDELLSRYAAGLPNVPVSRCPFCKRVIEIAMDEHGLDGPWWWVNRPFDPAPMKSCVHFRLLLGALDLHGRPPSEALTEVQPGPGTPYVIGRLLGMDGMKAVVSSRGLPSGDTAYLILYFSRSPLASAQSHQEWLMRGFQITSDSGEDLGWTIANDPWDFSLGPWAGKGKLLWIAPGDGTMALQEGSPKPYLGLEGTRKAQKITLCQLIQYPPPDGGPIDLSD